MYKIIFYFARLNTLDSACVAQTAAENVDAEGRNSPMTLIRAFETISF